MAREYAAFISYRHKPLDIAVATRLHKAIERFKIPGDLRREEQKNPGSVFTTWEGAAPEKMLVFRDRDELPLSNDLTSDIFVALDHAKCLIVVCTPDTPKSLWVRREISHYIEKHGRKRIITVLAAGTPEESIPKEITTVYAEDGVTVLEEFEPLVAYLVADSQREVMKNLNKERLRVCAALLGCPYDSLKQRHKRRKMQQALAVAAAAFMVALSFIGILVNRNLEIQAQKQEVEAQKQQVELQKQEAENQRRMVQLRESELLAADARAALDSGNTREAIENAVAALPKVGEEDRPYYAPAEAVLMEAMDVLGGTEENSIIKNTVLEQMTPVYSMDISNDGTCLATIDQYGVLHCYDTLSGEELWSDIMTTEHTYSGDNVIQISKDDQYLISLYDETMECRSLRDGMLLWNYEMRRAVEGYFIYDDTQNRIAMLHTYTDSAIDAYVLKLVVLSAATGQVEQEILLEQLEEAPAQNEHYASQGRLPDGGVFSADGRYFACAFSREYEKEGKSLLMCFVADLQEGTVYRSEKQIPCNNFSLAKMRFYDDGLVTVLEPRDDDSVAGVLVKLDWKTGRLLWQTETPSELDEGMLIIGRATHVLLTRDYALVGKNDKLYAIDLENGEIRHSATFPGILSAMYPAGDTYFAFALEDGTYAIGWYNPNSGFELTTSNFMNLYTNVGRHTVLQIHGGGIVQYYTDGNYMELSVSNVDRPGYLVAVSEDNPNRIVIKRPVVLEKTLAPTFTQVPLRTDRFTGSEAHSVELKDGWVIGRFRFHDEEGKTQGAYLHVDTVTGEVRQVTETKDSSFEEYFFLHDGSGYVNISWSDSAVLNKNGRETELLPQYVSADDYYRFSCDGAYLRNGKVLVLFADSEMLTVFEDGVEKESVALPEVFQDEEAYSFNFNPVVTAGRNGYGLVQRERDVDGTTVMDVAFYDTAAGTWVQPDMKVPLHNADTYAFAENAPLFAAVDGEHTVRVWNLQTGKETAAFPLQLPYNSVLHMDFLLDDSCLMVKTKDAKVLVYEAATGQILLQDQLETTYSGILQAHKDPVSQRLYIIDNSMSGINTLCIDMESWTVLARAENIITYRPESNQLYYADSSYTTENPGFYSFRVPTTAELVKMGQQILENDSVS